ncbi:ornithine cyclodeaminase [Demequina pelophila]|uniref:ornithine cyclodeaminase n=1 Tax=Demequina pelophila TaxID=1638984 RepID=UPI000782CEE3|nr:ornithine cyclodeaminase [Demequina pelophila]
MVMFVDVAHMRGWMAEHGVETLIADLIPHLEEDFRRWPEFDKVARIASHSPVGVIELMPVADSHEYGFKYVNGHPFNPRSGRQTVTAFGVLADVQTGYPVLLAEMSLLTALRTAATSAMAARALARPGSRVHALLGAGSQSEFQAVAMRAAVGADRVRVWDTDPDAIDKFLRHAATLGIEATRASSAVDAVAGADIVTTCTADKANATIVTDAMVEPGMHLNAIGGDCPGKTELDAAILHRASTFVEYEPQTRIEGEIQQVPADHPVTELWRVLTDAAPGRTSPDQITVFDSVGFAVEDRAALRFLRDSVAGTAHCTDIDLVAEPRDPKDLFSLVSPALAASRV